MTVSSSLETNISYNACKHRCKPGLHTAAWQLPCKTARKRLKLDDTAVLRHTITYAPPSLTRSAGYGGSHTLPSHILGVGATKEVWIPGGSALWEPF